VSSVTLGSTLAIATCRLFMYFRGRTDRSWPRPRGYLPYTPTSAPKRRCYAERLDDRTTWCNAAQCRDSERHSVRLRPVRLVWQARLLPTVPHQPHGSHYWAF
jgi:hypothetical protein